MKCFGSKNTSCHCKIVLLDDQELIQDVQESTLGQEVLDNVFRHLNLLETAYFGLRFLRASSQPFWLDPKKKVVQQLKGWGAFTMYFCVKFYSADPCRLLEEITRYQFFLQIKQDILQGRLPVTWETAAELGARIIQSELGDFDPSRHGPDYVTEFRLCPNQTAQTEQRTAEIHQALTGQTPAQAEYAFLEKVRWLEMYGVDLHSVLGEDHTEYFIGLTPSGIIVLRGNTKVSNYFWPRISKVYFKGRYFMLRVRDKNNEESTFGFETPSKHACKHLWKCSVEHHSFFRLVQVTHTGRGKPLSISSRFRYSGRTEKEVQREASLHRRPQPSFSRTSSRRSANSQTPNRHGPDEADKRSMCRSVISVPQPVQSYSAMQRASSVTFDGQSRAESPRSVRSAPFSANQLPGLFSNSTLIGRARRSASADSQSSVDARSLRRRHRRQSGNESDASSAPGSSRSHRKHRHRRDESCSESERSCTSRKHRSRKHRQRGESGSVDMVDSEPQWREIQRRQLEDGLSAAGGFNVGPPAAVVSPAAAAAAVQHSAPLPHRSGYQNSGMETESELSFQTKRRVRKHRSRSRSPESERLRRLPAELRKHLQFELVEPGPELHEASIPYTRVETTGRMPRVKYATKRTRHDQCAADAVHGSRHVPTSTANSFSPPHSAFTPPTATSTPLMTNHYSVPPSRPRPVAALVSSPGSSAPSGSSVTPSANTLSNFYVTPSSASVPAISSFCAPPMASIGVPLRPPSRFVPHPLAGAAHQEPASHEHSDSGLGNESPNEFIRIAGSASPPPLPPSMPPVAISSSSTLPRFRLAPTSVAPGAVVHQHHLVASSSSTAAPSTRLSITGSLPRPRGRSSADILQTYTSRGCPVIQPPVSFRNSPPVVSPSPSPSMPPPLPPLGSSRTDGFVGELRQLLAHQLDISDTSPESGPLVTGEVMSGVMRPLTRGHRSDSAGSLELILSPLVNSAQTSRR